VRVCSISTPGALRKRVFGIDIESCRVCGGAVRIIACIEDPDGIEKILTHLDAKAARTKALMRPPCRASPKRGCSTDRIFLDDERQGCNANDAARPPTVEKAVYTSYTPR
jgi:hypothetical protein